MVEKKKAAASSTGKRQAPKSTNTKNMPPALKAYHDKKNASKKSK